MPRPPNFRTLSPDPSTTRLALSDISGSQVSGGVFTRDTPQFTWNTNMSRLDCNNAAISMTSGTIYVVGPPIIVPAGSSPSNVGFASGTTALATATHQWAGLCSIASSPVVLAVSTDSTSSSWAANITKNFAISFSPTIDTPAYAFICVVATTPPTLQGAGPLTVIAQSSFVISTTSSTGQTTPPANGATLGAVATGTSALLNVPYFYLT